MFKLLSKDLFESSKIRDTFPEEKDYEIAFHPFTRLDKSRNQNNHSGVGLGLSIANDVIRMHGGQLSLYKSTALGGLGVRIRLPI